MNQNESLLDMQTYRTMLNTFEAGLTAILSEYAGFIAARSDASEKRSAILKEYRAIDNIFSPIFKFRLENFHSEILRMLLYKNAQGIGCMQYLNLFTRLLKDIRPSLKNYTFSDAVSVVCEAGEKQEDGRIDIFISDERYGIIIENKINGAADQPNQLAKYLKFAKRLEKEIIAVVYIPPPWKNSAPDLERYAESFQEYIPELREKLVVLPVADIHTKKDLVHGFLGACLDLPENTETQKYMLSQYTKLLVSIKGVKEMTKDVDMALLAECYKDKKSISVLENLAEIWNNRNSLLCGILRDTVRERLVNELGFTVDIEDEYGLYKNINSKVALCFYNDDENEKYMFGFWGEDTLTSGLRTALKSVLDAATPEYFGETDVWGNPKRWLIKPFIIGECKKPLSDITEHLIGRYRFLEETARKALETAPEAMRDYPQEYDLGEECWNTVRAKLKEEFGYSTRKKDIDLYEEIKDTLHIYISANNEEYRYWLGFWSDKELTVSANSVLQKIADEVLPEKYFGETEDWDEPGHWLVKPFRITAYAKSSQEDVAEYLAGRLHQLKEKAAQVLKA